MAVDGELSVDLTPWQRYLVAAATFRPSRTTWAERFFKSNLGYRLRSANANRGRRSTGQLRAAVLQVHALFEVQDAPGLLYVDCTYRQAAEQWPAWNPLRGRLLRQWYARERAAYHRAAHVFAFSAQTRDSLVDHYGVDSGRVSVVGAGINARSLPVTGRRVRPLGTPPMILFVGNDFSRKGGPVLLEAFTTVRAMHPEARLVLVGTRPDLPPLPGVEVLGRLHDRESVHALYREADVFALPSLFDPLPLVLLEAMSHELPCVVTGTAGVPDVVTDGQDAHLVAPGDARELADALLRVLADPAGAAAVGAAGRRRVEEAFTWDAVVERMLPVLRLHARVRPGS